MPYVRTGGADIWWEEEGAGEPVLMVMGLGYPGAMWYRLVPYLADRYRTIRPDNRGVGRTGEVAGPYTMEQMADDAVAVLDAAGERSAHVVGVSMGGVIAQEIALRHPGRVRSLVLGCTHPGGREAVPLSAEAAAMLTRRADQSPAEAAEAAVPFVYAPGTSRARIEEDFAVRMRVPTSPRGYAAQLGGVIGHGGTASRLGEIAVPTLVVHGATDRLVPPANATFLAGHIPGARLLMIDGASHIFFTDRTEEAGAALRAFLDGHPTP